MLKLIFLLLLLKGFELFSQSIEYARTIINTLSSENYMGRGYSGNGDLKTSGFIRKEFNKSGICPLGDNYFQYFNMDVNTFPGKMEVRLNDNDLIPGINFLVDPASSPLRGKFKVLTIRRQDLINIELLKKILNSSAGKAILINLNDTIKFNKSEEEAINRIIEGIKYDTNIKNSLTIILSDKKLTWGISTWQAKKAGIIVNSASLSPGGISEITVNIKSIYKIKYQTRNVLGIITGKSIPDSFLVITAHYDHLGIMGKDTYFPGANDNASGIAMMLNLSRYFSANPPKYSMVFIAFSGEEAGLLGSEYFIRNPLFEIQKIKFLINFDLSGTGDDGIKVVNATVFKTEFEKLQKINDQNHYLPSVQPRGEACISDHCVFYNRNIPCFYIYTLGGISAYHDVFDKAETLPLTEFEDYCQLMILFLNKL
jgi:aminopeptidase YwaD